MMMPASVDFNDLISDVGHLSTLIDVATSRVIDFISPDLNLSKGAMKEINVISNLLWIARDMVEHIDRDLGEYQRGDMPQRRQR